MTQTPFDQMSKQYLEEFLAPFGRVERQYEIPGKAKFVDVWFIPNSEAIQNQDLGLLGRMVQHSCLLEPYRNAPSRTEMRVSVMKLIWVQEDERRKVQKQELAEEELPWLWILAATTSKSLLQDANGVTKPDWMLGVYFTANIFRTAIVAIDELPETEETLWLRILGRGATQERAIREVLALSPSHPKRNTTLRLLANWKVRIDLGELMDFAAQEELMALSEAFLAWEQETQSQGQIQGQIQGQLQGQLQGQRSLILRQLQRRLGVLPDRVIDRINGFPIEQLESLGEALLDFESIDDLAAWLENRG